MSRFTRLGGALSGFGYIPPGGDTRDVLRKVNGDDCVAEWHTLPVAKPAVDFDAAGDGVTNDTDAVIAMFASDEAVDFGFNKTYLIDPIIVSAVPPSIHGKRITLKARTAGDDLIELVNPHSSFERFRWDGSFIFDANRKCGSAFKLHGSQRCYYGSMQFINALEANCRVHGDFNNGNYYNVFNDWIAGGEDGLGSNDRGFECISPDNTNRIQANTWISPKSIWNEGDGYYLDHCTDTFVGWEAERNDRGMVVDSCLSLTLLGGYSENNGTPDTTLVMSANSNRVMLIGGRHIGDITGYNAGGFGHIILPGADANLEITPDYVLLPTLTTAQRDAISARRGMMLYNSTTNKFQGYNGSGWQDFH